LGFGSILTPYILETLRAIKKSGLIWLFSDFRGEDLNVKVILLNTINPSQTDFNGLKINIGPYVK
jgi:hypothetical protein